MEWTAEVGSGGKKKHKALKKSLKEHETVHDWLFTIMLDHRD